MFTLSVIGLYALAYLCTFAWLWRFVIEAIIGRRSPRPLWPAWEFSPRYVAQLLQRIVYCTAGVLVAVVTLWVLIMVMARI
jgi:hypothetical protein